MSGGLRRPTSRGTLLQRNDVDSANRFHSDARIQNAKSARVYVFGDADVLDDELEEEMEMPEIRSRRSQPFKPIGDESEFTYLEHSLIDGDTIQSLSIRYACPVSELKRVNNLIRDQDMFGLKTLKIPIKKHGILLEIAMKSESAACQKLNKSCTRDTISQNDYDDSADNLADVCNLSDPETQRRIIHTLSINDVLHSQTKEAEEFLRSMDEDLVNLRESTRTSRNSLDEVISVLTSKSIQPLGIQNTNKMAADYGLRFKNVIAAIIIISVLLPLIIFIYFKFMKGS